METFDINKFKEQCQRLLTRAEKKIAVVKESMAALLLPENAENFNIDRLNDSMAALAITQGYKRITKEMLSAHENIDRLSLCLYLSRHLANYAGDTWSGRGNDFRRSISDGEKQAIRDILDLLEYESCLSL